MRCDSSKIFLYLLLLLFSHSMKAGDVSIGKKKYERFCASCHGARGQGNVQLGSPALAEQSPAYLVRQLNNFSSGVRGADGNENPDAYVAQMQAGAASLESDADRLLVAEYLHSLKLEPGQRSPVKGNVEEGYKVYQSACGACHGGQAQGNEALNSPRLDGLSADYLLRQYTNFVKGRRGSHKEDKFGRQMKMMAATITDETKIQNVIAYIQSLRSLESE